MTTTKKTTKKKAVFDFRTIKTVEDAFKKNGYDSTKLPDLSMIPEKFRTQLTTCFLLMVIFEAINDGWEPDFSNHNQGKYYPWPWVSSSRFSFSRSDSYCDSTHTTVGSRLCTDTSEKALYILNQFPDMWKSWLLNVNPE
jgi:hypothetical protein